MLRQPNSRQLGQTLIWFLATLAASCVALVIVFNVGQVATEKERTTSAADAVALSGGLVQARFMNLLAYNNRTIVADEMTIAQFAALDSWVAYNYQLTQNLALVTSWIPGVDEITASIAEVMQEIAQVVNEGATLATEFFQINVDVLEAERETVLRPEVIAPTVYDMATQVAAKNNVDLNENLGFMGLSTAALLATNEGFFVDHTKSGSGKDDRKDINDIVMNSRDAFTTWRGAGSLIDNANSLASLGGLNPFTPALVKTSGTTALRDYDHWESQDSMDATVKICYIFGCSTFDVLPVGWGRANVNEDGDNGKNWATTPSPANYNMLCQGGYTLACSLAYRSNVDSISGWSGLPDMLDVKSADRQTDVRYYVSVKTKDTNPPLTAQRLGIATTDLAGPQGSTRVSDNLLKGQIQTISAARIFFKRPKRDAADRTGGGLFRNDNVQEYGSLYNPYWQARLHTPNCKASDPGSEDCRWRGLLAIGNGTLAAEAVLDIVTPP